MVWVYPVARNPPIGVRIVLLSIPFIKTPQYMDRVGHKGEPPVLHLQWSRPTSQAHRYRHASTRAAGHSERCASMLRAPCSICRRRSALSSTVIENDVG